MSAPAPSPHPCTRCRLAPVHPGLPLPLPGMDLLIGGTARPPPTAAPSTCSSPLPRDVLTTIASGTAADAAAAVAAARAAFDAGIWSGRERHRSRQGAARGRRAAPRAGRGASPTPRPATPGNPIGNARWEVNAAADVFEYFAGAANKHFGEVVPVQDDGLDVVLREPVGVCALIVPVELPAAHHHAGRRRRRWRAATR